MQNSESTQAIAPAVLAHRMANATLTLRHNGAPLANQDVQVSQTRHKFLFGSTWGGDSMALANGELSGKAQEQAELRGEHFTNIFNLATLPFYWARFEPQQGQPQIERTLKAAQWYAARNCILKGHPLCWHTLSPDWLLEMSNSDILKTQVSRIKRDVAAFAGIIDMWDVINEAVIMPIFDRYDNGMTRLAKEMGRIELIRTVFDTARATNPNAQLILNDFDVSPAYDILVEGCLAAGIQIDVIGIQSHMHQGYWGVERTLSILERFARFNLPIHFTETNLVSGQLMPPEIVDLNDYQVADWPSTPAGEERQAEEARLHFKTLFEHPAVEAITWWDFTDGGWLNAPTGLLRADYSRKPSYDALHELIKGEWWFKTTSLTTDDQGRIAFTGFLGDYALSVGNRSVAFSLTDKGDVSLSLDLP